MNTTSRYGMYFLGAVIIETLASGLFVALLAANSALAYHPSLESFVTVLLVWGTSFVVEMLSTVLAVFVLLEPGPIEIDAALFAVVSYGVATVAVVSGGYALRRVR